MVDMLHLVLELCSGCIMSILCPILVRKIPTGHTRMVGQSVCACLVSQQSTRSYH